MSEQKYLAYRGQLTALVGIADQALFVTRHVVLLLPVVQELQVRNA